MGARPLRRAIQRYVEDPLADEVLRQGEIVPGTTVLVERDADGDDEERPLKLKLVKPRKRPKKKPEPVGVGAEAGRRRRLRRRLPARGVLRRRRGRGGAERQLTPPRGGTRVVIRAR